MSTREERLERSPAERRLVMLAGGFGALAVGLGAYGAHGLERALEGVADAARRIAWWETAVLYHLTHALAIGLVACLAARAPRARAVSAAGISFATGVVLFSGTLYAMALGAPRWLGAVTPLGGVALIAGWILVLVAGLRRRA